MSPTFWNAVGAVLLVIVLVGVVSWWLLSGITWGDEDSDRGDDL